MLRNFTSEGIVLARKSYSEADRILSIFSKDLGRISVIAKGVRKPKSRKRGHLEVFNYFRFQATQTKSIHLITEAEVIDSFKQVRKDLKRVSLAYYFMEVTGKLSREHERNQELFELILNYLNRLKSEKSLKSLRKEFVYDALTLLGFWPKGRPMENPDKILEQTLERKLSSLRVGKRVLAS